MVLYLRIEKREFLIPYGTLIKLMLCLTLIPSELRNEIS